MDEIGAAANAAVRQSEERIQKLKKESEPKCGCFPCDSGKEVGHGLVQVRLSIPILEGPNCGPYYTHLGYGTSLAELRNKLEKQTGTTGAQIRIEKARFVSGEGKNKTGCPVAKFVSLCL